MIQLQDSVEQRASQSKHPLLQRFLRATFVITGTNFIDLFTWLLACWLGAFGALVVRARLYTGEWPRPHDNPFAVGHRPDTIRANAFPLLHSAVLLGFVALVFVLPGVILYLVGCIFSPALRPSRRLAVAFVALSALVTVIWVYDPFGFLLWFAD